LIGGGHVISSRARRAFALIEVVGAMLIVGGLLVAALTALGAAKASQANLALRAQGRALAHGLLGEALRQHYEEPDDTPAFGREGDEDKYSRALWDDVDDYRMYYTSPPENADGSEIEDYSSDWTQMVDVVWVDPTDTTQVSATATGVKRVTVYIYHKSTLVGEAVGLRTAAWPAPGTVEVAP
jgi:type II secretory pathway pseudopilin PulG